MADFTLEDIGKQTEAIVERALIKEREHTRTMVTEIMTEAFDSFWDHNLSPVLEDMHQDIKDVKVLTRQHSKDIMELRARIA